MGFGEILVLIAALFMLYRPARLLLEWMKMRLGGTADAAAVPAAWWKDPKDWTSTNRAYFLFVTCASVVASIGVFVWALVEQNWIVLLLPLATLINIATSFITIRPQPSA